MRYIQNRRRTIMAANTASKINDVTETRRGRRTLSCQQRKLVEAGKKTANAALDGYEKTSPAMSN
jgi:hypothetical protein